MRVHRNARGAAGRKRRGRVLKGTRCGRAGRHGVARISRTEWRSPGGLLVLAGTRAPGAGIERAQRLCPTTAGWKRAHVRTIVRTSGKVARQRPGWRCMRPGEVFEQYSHGRWCRTRRQSKQAAAMPVGEGGGDRWRMYICRDRSQNLSCYDTNNVFHRYRRGGRPAADLGGNQRICGVRFGCE